VREVEIEYARTLGSHRFFVARIISDERHAACEELHLIEGIYQAWRVRGRSAELEASVAADSRNKNGGYSSQMSAATAADQPRSR
jgi:hypothetical protein